MTTMKTLGQRIAHYRKQTGLSQRELAAQCGWKSQSRIGNYEKDIREPNLRDLEQIAGALGLSLQQLVDDAPQASNNATPAATTNNEFEWAGGFDPWDDDTPLRNDEVEVPFYMEVELSAGVGSAQQLETEGPKLRFAKRTLAKCNVPYDNAACVIVSGNSMEPVLPDKSVVGIDRTITRIVKDGAMYALDHDGLLRVKRVYKMPSNRLRLNSFNKEEYPDELVDISELRILGKVFWWSVLEY